MSLEKDVSGGGGGGLGFIIVYAQIGKCLHGGAGVLIDPLWVMSSRHRHILVPWTKFMTHVHRTLAIGGMKL